MRTDLEAKQGKRAGKKPTKGTGEPTWSKRKWETVAAKLNFSAKDSSEGTSDQASRDSENRCDFLAEIVEHPADVFALGCL
ncbi:unnamed protein product [Sphagnum troendelagicum]|uniref:Uncharacterized protein n=1 Tax=Sphagnum jensenii TaxID=128206 RepID=A0ABP0W1L2_9BRYO